MDQVTLGKRLRKIRENSRLTQEQVVQILGIPRTAMVQIEAGRRSLSTLELSQLAELYHRPLTDFFPKEGVQVIVEEDLPFDNLQISRYLELCTIGASLRKVRTLPFYELESPTRPFEAIRQGERVAEEERRRLGLGYGPIANALQLIMAQGIWVSDIQGLCPDVSGVFLHRPSLGMVIFINRDYPECQRRFSYFHEYAHVLIDRKDITTHTTQKENVQELMEYRADAFASAFLMLKDGVCWFLDNVLEKGSLTRPYHSAYSLFGRMSTEIEERLIPGSQDITSQDVAVISHYFGVGYSVVTHRLYDLGFLNVDEKTRILQREGTLPLVQDHLVNEIIRLAIESYRLEEVSQGWLRDLSDKLGIPAEELIELAQDA